MSCGRQCGEAGLGALCGLRVGTAGSIGRDACDEGWAAVCRPMRVCLEAGEGGRVAPCSALGAEGRKAHWAG